jgi:hypothetical protein
VTSKNPYLQYKTTLGTTLTHFSVPTIFLLFPETSQKSLEEIDLLFGERALGTLPDHIEAKDVDDAVRRASAVNEKSIEVNQARVAEHNESI